MPVTLVALRGLVLGVALCLPGCIAAQSTVTRIESWTWPRETHHLGGFSGLEVSDDGAQLTAITDRGVLVRARFERENGAIVGVTDLSSTPLRDASGAVLLPGTVDSEGLAIGSDGQIHISFEGDVPRVGRFDDGGRARGFTDLPEAFPKPHTNSGPEALAIDGNGHLWTLPELSGSLTSDFPVWRYDGTWSSPFAIPRSGGFSPVGADVGPDGRLYLLERGFNGFGFRSRVRVFDVSGGDSPRAETILVTRTFRFDNLEGLSAWRDATGAIRLTLISDDNLNPLQKTQFVEVTLSR